MPVITLTCALRTQIKMEKIMFTKLNFKKCLSLAVVAVFITLASSTAFVAQADGHKKGGFSGPSNAGGFDGPGPKVVSIMNATKEADDTWITLKGKIIRHDGSDKYTFRDASGEGIIEIDDEAWNGVTVGPNDVVELVTKVDKDWGVTELEVKRINKVN